ncbi:MAG: tyrosine-protein phosphatase [Candidatus Obscuribacterales bacterium]|nr:tyrosine-protein phosphatase [Candidatus Obscuribacterales bacterium]
MSKKLTRILLIPATALMLSAQLAGAADTTTAPAKKIVDLPNFHQVHPFLYRGGEPTPEGVNQLNNMGVKTIFDLRNPGEKKWDEESAARKLGIKYIAMPMNSAAPTSKQVKTMMRAIESAKKAPADGSVFVHCAHGSDRTGCMMGIWRVTEEKWNYDAAYKEMRKYWFTPKFTNLSGAVRKYAEQTGGTKTGEDCEKPATEAK